MQIGISTACLYPQPLEDALKTLTSLGFHRFELFMNTYRELQPDFLNQLQEIAPSPEYRILSLHPFTSGFETTLFFSEYQRRFLDGVELYRNYFKAAQFLGASLLVFHGQKILLNSVLPEEEYMERYAYLYQIGKEYGITLAQENVNAFRSQDPGFIARMRRRLKDRCAFVLDCKQAVRAGFDPLQMVHAMGENLVHIHINDHAPGKDCLLPGAGTMNYKPLFTLLRDHNYQGALILEVYRHNFSSPEEFLGSRKFLQQILTEFS